MTRRDLKLWVADAVRSLLRARLRRLRVVLRSVDERDRVTGAQPLRRELSGLGQDAHSVPALGDRGALVHRSVVTSDPLGRSAAAVLPTMSPLRLTGTGASAASGAI
jgi:hypothetical protein